MRFLQPAGTEGNPSRLFFISGRYAYRTRAQLDVLKNGMDAIYAILYKSPVWPDQWLRTYAHGFKDDADFSHWLSTHYDWAVECLWCQVPVAEAWA